MVYTTVTVLIGYNMVYLPVRHWRACICTRCLFLYVRYRMCKMFYMSLSIRSLVILMSQGAFCYQLGFNNFYCYILAYL